MPFMGRQLWRWVLLRAADFFDPLDRVDGLVELIETTCVELATDSKQSSREARIQADIAELDLSTKLVVDIRTQVVQQMPGLRFGIELSKSLEPTVLRFICESRIRRIGQLVLQRYRDDLIATLGLSHHDGFLELEQVGLLCCQSTRTSRLRCAELR